MKPRQWGLFVTSNAAAFISSPSAVLTDSYTSAQRGAGAIRAFVGDGVLWGGFTKMKMQDIDIKIYIG
ncbi:MAG: hypothetical protein WAN35_08320 [Terracidiphilus sp.]